MPSAPVQYGVPINPSRSAPTDIHSNAGAGEIKPEDYARMSMAQIDDALTGLHPRLVATALVASSAAQISSAQEVAGGFSQNVVLPAIDESEAMEVDEKVGLPLLRSSGDEQIHEAQTIDPPVAC